MGVVISPDYNGFVLRYPQFVSPGGSQPVTEALYDLYFNEATIYQANNGAGPITDSGRALMLMQMLIAHIAALNTATSDGQDASPIVGRVSNATEGSVTVASENNYPPGTVQWYQQTKFGSAWWAATAQYRTMRYLPGPVMGVPAGQGRMFGRGCGFGRGCR